LLLCLLCAIVYFGTSRVVDSIRLLTESLASFRESLAEDISEGVQSGMSELERQRDRANEIARLDQETRIVGGDSDTHFTEPKPFVFRISAEGAALMEKLEPGSMAWANILSVLPAGAGCTGGSGLHFRRLRC
jgi:Sec-independent protein translocase protein TatA